MKLPWMILVFALIGLSTFAVIGVLDWFDVFLSWSEEDETYLFLAVVWAWVALLISAALASLYVVLFAKVWKYRLRLGDSPKHALFYATSVVVGKFANASGMRMYRRNRKAGKRGGLIEYKAGS